MQVWAALFAIGRSTLREQRAPALNPERIDASVLELRTAVRIGEPWSYAVSRAAKVGRISARADRIARLRLVSADGRPLPRWTPGSHIDVICGDTGLSRQYSLCGDPNDRDAFEIAVLRELDPSKEQAFEVELKDSGLVLTVRADETVLDALQHANIDVQSD